MSGAQHLTERLEAWQAWFDDRIWRHLTTDPGFTIVLLLGVLLVVLTHT